MNKHTFKYFTLMGIFASVIFFISSCSPKEEDTSCVMVKVKCKSVELAATGKYRYVFNIKNFDQNKSKFNGIVTISLISQEEHSIRNDEFELKDFASGTNKDVTIEANTGLVEVHGQSGISKYGFSIKSNSEKQAFEGFNNIEEYKLNEDYRIKPEYK